MFLELPTGFGKSLIFQLLPRVLKDLWKLERACVLVVTPLVSIMKDQVEELTGLGLRAFAIGGDEKGEKELVAGGFDVDIIYGIYYIFFPTNFRIFFLNGYLRRIRNNSTVLKRIF